MLHELGRQRVHGHDEKERGGRARQRGGGGVARFATSLQLAQEEPGGFKMTAAVKFSLLLAPLASALFWESSPSPSAPARDGALGVVDNMINENKVTIFSNSKCTSSAKAKTVLEDMGVPYLAIELDQRLDGQSLKAVLAERTGAKSLPYVFVHGQHVGGAAETRRAYETGELSHWVDSHWPGKVEDSKVLDLEANT